MHVDAQQPSSPPAPPAILARLPADHAAAAQNFERLWNSHRESAERLKLIRNLVGEKGFDLLLKIIVNRRGLIDAGFSDDRRGRETGTAMLSIALDALARHDGRRGRKEGR
jgi:hypothetical protein